MQPELRVLEHLGYILECLAEGIRSDAKTELGSLVRALRTDERYAIADAPAKADALEEAREYLRGTDTREGVARVSRVNRALWKRVMEEG